MGWTTDELGREEINEKSKAHPQYHQDHDYYHGLGRERLTGKRCSPTKRYTDHYVHGLVHGLRLSILGIV